MTSVFHREYLAPALAGCPSIVFAPKRVELTTASHASHENSSDASESDATSGYARLQARPYKTHIESRMAGTRRRVRSPQSDDSYLKDLKPGKNLMNPAFGPSIAIVTAPEPMNHGSLASAAALPWSKFMNTPDGYILGLASRLTRSIGTGPPSIALRLHTCANKHTCGVGERELSSLPGTSSFVENAYFGN